MIQFPNYLTLDCAKPVGGMCQQLRWYIHTNSCFDFALRFIVHSSLLACIHASLILSLWFTYTSIINIFDVFVFISYSILFFTLYWFHCFTLCTSLAFISSLFLHTATFVIIVSFNTLISQFLFSKLFIHDSFSFYNLHAFYISISTFLTFSFPTSAFIFYASIVFILYTLTATKIFSHLFLYIDQTLITTRTIFNI